MRIVSTLLVMLVLGAFPAAASDRHALVIGVNAYQTAPLRLAVADAQLVGAALEEIGFRVEYVLDPDRAKLIGAIAEFSARVDEDDVSVFYFAGNGVQVSGENYFFGTDVRFDDPDPLRQGFTIEKLVADVTADAFGTHVFIFDACRDNPFPAAAHRGLAITAPVAHPDTFIMYSTQAGGLVMEPSDQPNTYFAAALAERLVQPGLPLVDLARDVRRLVVDQSGGEQRPTYYSDSSGDIFLAGAPR
jgi:uncharacterized caspase-like protein